MLGQKNNEVYWNSNAMITVEGGLAVYMINNSGNNSVKGSVICQKYFVEAGDAGSQLSAWSFVGASASNTNSGLVYWNLLDAGGGNRTVNIYSDAAKSVLVASGTRSGNGVVTLAQQGGSGLSGVVSLSFSGADTDAGNILTLPYGNDFTVCGTSQATGLISPIGVVYDDAIANGGLCRVIIAGRTDVLIQASLNIQCGDWIRTSSGTAGRAMNETTLNVPNTSSVANAASQIGWALQSVAGAASALCLTELRF